MYYEPQLINYSIIKNDGLVSKVRKPWIQKFLDCSWAAGRLPDWKKQCPTEAVMAFILTYILLLVFCLRVQCGNY